MVDKILFKLKFTDVDNEDFYSLANEIFVDVLKRYDKKQDFNGFLYSCLCNKFKTEMTRRNREKRKADKMALSWETPIGDEDGGSMKITIDVNGREDKNFPNCGHKSVSYVGELGTGNDSSCSSRENGYDRFQVTVKGNGQVTINPADVWAVNAVKVNRNITSDKNSNDEDD